MKLRCVLIVILALSSNAVIAERNFYNAELPFGASIDVPKGWRILSGAERRFIKNYTNKMLKKSGLKDLQIAQNKKTHLISANSMPRSTYGSMRLTVIRPAIITPSEIISLSQIEKKRTAQQLKEFYKKNITKMGIRLLNFKYVGFSTLNGWPVLSFHYRRTGLKGPVDVEILQIYHHKSTFHLNLAYRESEQKQWQPVIKHIRQSFRIKDK